MSHAEDHQELTDLADSLRSNWFTRGAIGLSVITIIGYGIL